MKDSLILRFLYRTVPGRVMLKVLTEPKVSQAAGHLLSSKASKCLVPYYIRKHKIDMSGIDIPAEGFSSFNAFFTRKHLMESFDQTPGHLICPSDGFLRPVKIEEDMVFTIKNTGYSLADLLKDSALAKKFAGGWAFIFRLTPANYHRYCYAVSGQVFRSRKIKGKLHCVRPIALRTIPVFAQNSREYQIIRAEGFGTVVQMEIGALLVGKISNRPLPADERYVQRGEEKGFFEFGGSTVILLIQKDMVHINTAFFQRVNDDGEIPVQMGEAVAWLSRQ